MEIKFDKTYLEELFFTGKTTDKKYRFQPHCTIFLVENCTNMKNIKLTKT